MHERSYLSPRCRGWLVHSGARTQVSGRSDLPWDETVRLDVYYVDNWSVMQDLSILMRTAGAVLGSRGAY